MHFCIFILLTTSLALAQYDYDGKRNKLQKPEGPQVVPSQISKGTYYYVEDRKYSKEQEKEWKRRCRRKYKLQDEFKDCYQKLKKEYLEGLE